MTCPRCGRDLFVDFRAKLRRCSGCDRGPSFCTCQPVAFRPAWTRNLRARDESGNLVAA